MSELRRDGSDELKEKCAVVAVAADQAAEIGATALFALQHRGPEATGLVTQRSDGTIQSNIGQGLTQDVHTEEEIAKLEGDLAVGQDKYSTNGSKHKHWQPVKDEAIGAAMGHNGNLPKTGGLDCFLERHNILTGPANDSEKASLSLFQAIRSGLELPDAVERIYPMLEGAFSCVALHGGLIVAFRGAVGIRPLEMGTLDGDGTIFASETCAIDSVDGLFERSVRPGELVVAARDGGIIETRQLAEGQEKLDLFEFVYFAREDTRLYGRSVHGARTSSGEKLAEQHPPITDDPDNILVTSVPETSGPAAEGYAHSLGLTYGKAIVKNRYVGRSFLMPTNDMRRKQLRRKHNIIPEKVVDKDMIVIDDSAVRFNTAPRLIKQLKAAGARSVMFLLASPPIRFPNFYGIDTPAQDELTAANYTIEEMRRMIGADYLGYLSLGRLVEAIGVPADMLEMSALTGKYSLDIGENKHKIYAPVSMDEIDL